MRERVLPNIPGTSSTSIKNVRQLKVTGIELPPMLSRVALHLGFQKFQQARQDPGVILKLLCIFLQTLFHVVHPLLCTFRVHDRISIILMMEVEPRISTVIEPASTKGIYPEGSLGKNVVILWCSLLENFLEPRYFLVRKD